MGSAHQQRRPLYRFQIKSNFMAKEPKKHEQPDLDDAEQRANERRAQEAKLREAEAEAEVNKQIAEGRAVIEKEKSDAALRAKVISIREELVVKAAMSETKLVRLKQLVNAITTAVGDIHGAIITANDVAKHDPARALAGIERARAAFESLKVD
jgi:multidrug resistance efflux pump